MAWWDAEAPLRRLARRVRAHLRPAPVRAKARIEFHGDFASWDEALAASTGYDAQVILDRVRQATLQVKQGRAAYERDSVVFQRMQHFWPVTAALLWAAARCGNRLRLIDFGGALGTSYHQQRQWLTHLQELSWNVVEQPHFVASGREMFPDGLLRFHDDLDTCARETRAEVFFASSVLQYLPDPWDLLDQVVELGFGVVVLDRVSCLAAPAHRLVVQDVPPSIYPASYPCWMFNYDQLLERLTTRYAVMGEFISTVGASYLVDGIPAGDRGLILQRCEN